MSTQNPNVANRHDQVFAAGLETADGTVVGLTSTSKLGFFGTAPVVQGTLTGSTATAAQIVTELARLGIVINAG